MKRVLVAGELNADLLVSGLPSLPVLGQEIIGGGFTMTLGSSSAITAARLAVLCADDAIAVDFIGLIGDDEIGRFVLARLAEFGVHTAHIAHADGATGITIGLTYARDRAFVTVPGVMTRFDGSAITPELLKDYTHLHIGSFFLQTGLQPHIARIFEQAKAIGVSTSLDVGWDPSLTWMKNPHLAPALNVTGFFMPNSDETAALADSPQALADQVGGTLIVKEGSKGASAYWRSAAGTVEMLHTDAFPVSVIDTTGAGDAFNAGFIYARRLCGKPLDEALRFAAACGAQAVMHIGGATNAPSARQIDAFLNP